MINWKRNLFFVWLSQILSLAGFGSVIPFIPLYMRNVLGVMDDGERGLWVSAFYFGGQLSFCISTPIWGALADRFGRRVMLLRANLVTACLFPLMAYVPGVIWLVAVRFLISIFSGTVNAAQTLVGSTTPQEHQGFALGTLSSALWSGNLIGYLAGGLVVDHFGYTPAFYTGAGMLLSAGIIVLLFVKDDFDPHALPVKPAQEEKEPFSFKKLIPDFGRVVWILLFLFVYLGFVRKFDDPFIAIQVELIHGPERAAFWTGVICAGAAVAGVFSGIVLGWLCDRFSPGKIAIPATLLSGLLMIPQGMATSLWIFGGARFLNFFFAGGLDPGLPDHHVALHSAGKTRNGLRLELQRKSRRLPPQFTLRRTHHLQLRHPVGLLHRRSSDALSDSAHRVSAEEGETLICAGRTRLAIRDRRFLKTFTRAPSAHLRGRTGAAAVEHHTHP